MQGLSLREERLFAEGTQGGCHTVVFEHLADGNIAVVSRIGVADHGTFEILSPRGVVGADTARDIEFSRDKGGEICVVERVVRGEGLRNGKVLHRIFERTLFVPAAFNLLVVDDLKIIGRIEPVGGNLVNVKILFQHRDIVGPPC